MWHPLRRKCALWLIMSLMTVAVVGCTGKNAGPNGAPGKKDQAERRSADAPSTVGGAKQIVIDNFTFDPPTLTVPAGTQVTWVNHDDVPHTVTSTAKPKQFGSGTLDTDGQFSHVFTNPGNYEYFCAIHPKMTGRIIVQ